MLHIGMFQDSPRIGDFAFNLGLLKKAFTQASDAGVPLDIVVATELASCGYYPQDLLANLTFIERAQQVDAEVLEYSKNFPQTALVYGSPYMEVEEAGLPPKIFNSLRVVKGGRLLGRYDKTMLPTSGLFNERRMFSEGAGEPLVLNFEGHKVGFLICEDLWGAIEPSQHYSVDPVANTVQAGAELLVSINASPYEQNKIARRLNVIQSIAGRYNVPVIYVNQVVAEEHVIYDGGSMAVDASGQIVAALAPFKEDFGVVSFANGVLTSDCGPSLRADGTEYLADALCFGLKQYLDKSGMQKVIVGCSGGLDSAITIALAARAIGPENVLAVTMPSKYSSEGSVSDSVALCQGLGVELKTVPIESIVSTVGGGINDVFGAPPSGVARENLQARARGTILMTLANQYGYLLLTTGNKSEASVGYFTLYGDSCGGLNLIGDLYKTEVYALSYALNAQAGREVIPLAILEKAPSAELAPGQQDADSLPAYPVLDFFLKQTIDGMRVTPKECISFVSKELGRQTSAEEVNAIHDRIRSLVRKSEFKRFQMAPTLRVKQTAFGQGRQVPMTSAWTA